MRLVTRVCSGSTLSFQYEKIWFLLSNSNPLRGLIMFGKEQTFAAMEIKTKIILGAEIHKLIWCAWHA